MSSTNINVERAQEKVPAERKSPSQKEQKGIGEPVEFVYDWWEETLKVEPTFLPDPMEVVNSVMKVFVPEKEEEREKKEEEKGKCKVDCICNLSSLLIKDGFIENLQIKKNRVFNLEQSKFNNPKQLSGIILHRTVTKTTQATLNAFNSKRNDIYYGTHFIVGKDGEILQTAHLDYKTNHAKGWNSKSVGIEVVGMPIDKNGNSTIKDNDIIGWENLTEKQAKSTACLCKVLLKYYSLTFEDLHCHEHVASKTKGEGEYVLNAIKPYFK